MKKTKTLILLIMLFCYPAVARATIIFDDGQTHNIDYAINDYYVDVRNDNFSGLATTLNLLSGGGIVGTLGAYGNSMVNISGGYIGDDLSAWDNSIVTVSGGSIGDDLFGRYDSVVSISGGSINDDLYACNRSVINISGGVIYSYLQALDNSVVNISDGSINNGLGAYYDSKVNISGGYIGNDLDAWDNSVVTFNGTGFAINGIPVAYGIFDNGGEDGILGRLTGTLANGDYLDNEVYINGNSSIVLIPEPATFLLLSFGAVMLRTRR